MVWVLPFLLALPLADTPQAKVAQPAFSDVSRRAEEARSADKLPDAIRLYRLGVRLRPSWSEGWWGLGSIYYEQDRFADAQEAFRHFVATSPKATPGYAFLGLCEYETRNFDSARRHFSQWALNGSPGNDRLIDVAFFHWALLLTQDGRFLEALYILDKAAQHHNPNPLLIEGLGLAWLRMRNLPEDYPPELREMVWLTGTATVFASKDNYVRAQEYAGRLAAHYGDRPNVHYFRGMLYGFEKKQEEAEAEFRRELEISPGSALAMIQLALTESLFRAQLDEAKDLALKATKLEPDNVMAHYALGTILFLGDELQSSVHELQTAAKLAPGSARVHFQLARVYSKLGQTKDFDREKALFDALKDKQEVFATTEEKLGDLHEATEPAK